MPGLLDNNIVQGTGYVADAYARVVIDKKYDIAYTLVVKAIAAFGAANAVRKLASDMEVLRAKGELPDPPAPPGGDVA